VKAKGKNPICIVQQLDARLTINRTVNDDAFVVQQLIAQAGWTDPDLRFWHYRDKDQVEVDVVVTRGRKTWGVEIKAGSTVRNGDANGLLRLADRCGDDFQRGVLLYAGKDVLPLDDKRLLAVPISELWA
jgi:predicted AAA+ superfamily ATPase